jgi:hypothetical protein
MSLNEMVEMEMELIEKEEVALLDGMVFLLGGCGINNGWGACGEGGTVN